MVHDRSGSILRWTGLDSTISDKIIDAINRLLSELAMDPRHPLRVKIEESLRDLAERLRHDPAMQARVHALKAEHSRQSGGRAMVAGRLGAAPRRNHRQAARSPGRPRRPGRRAAAPARRHAGARPPRPPRPQPLRPPRHRRHRRRLWRRHRPPGLGHRAPLGRAHHLRPARRRRRPRSSIYPDQRHSGRRSGRPLSSTRSRCWHEQGGHEAARARRESRLPPGQIADPDAGPQGSWQIRPQGRPDRQGGVRLLPPPPDRPAPRKSRSICAASPSSAGRRRSK